MNTTAEAATRITIPQHSDFSPVQRQIIEGVRERWKRELPAVVAVGQGGGTTFMLRWLLQRESDLGNRTIVVSVLAKKGPPHPAYGDIPGCDLMSATELLAFIHGQEMKKRRQESVGFDDVRTVAIDGCFDIWDGEGLVQCAARYAPRVVAMGSPSFSCMPWRSCFPRYPTWEVNPLVSKESLDRAYAADSRTASILYGCGLPRLVADPTREALRRQAYQVHCHMSSSNPETDHMRWNFFHAVMPGHHSDHVKMCYRIACELLDKPLPQDVFPEEQSS